jgi:hypothetical protein
MNDARVNKLETADDKYVRVDRMRYEKNKLSSTLAILAIVWNALFFVSIYKSDVGVWYYSILVGASIVYNLLFMMIVFLISEGSKSYKINYSYVAIVVGALQFVRIFIYPRLAHAAQTQATGEIVQVMKTPQYVRVVVYLVASGICLIASAVIGIQKCNALKKHMGQMQGSKA